MLNKKRFRILGLTPDDVIKYFFQGNAAVAILVLVLIMVFLLREGAGFFGQNLRNLRIYRLAGLEYVDFIKREVEAHTELTRAANALRMRQFDAYLKEGKTIEKANEALAQYDVFATAFGDTVNEVRSIASDMTEAAVAIKEKEQIYRDILEQKAMLLRAGRSAEAEAVVASSVDFKSEVEALKAMQPAFLQANVEFASKIKAALALGGTEPLQAPYMGPFNQLKTHAETYLNSFASVEAQMARWTNDQPIPWYESVTAFLFGREWLTASFWQDWYGVIPLFVGSLLVSAIALAIAVPLGVAGAIYVSEIASVTEKGIIKPYIEFISAIPSVVLGFFGVAVLGQCLRAVSQTPWLSWFPGFPMSERLNSLTAGCLLALMAIPTIFSLAEDALNNVPRHFKEASYALGATRFQTIVRILMPASLSGIISAILLGFGRVIGETMVVLLCAGNRIAIPDFTQGIGAFFQPVHTMTGIIAQEMGEVVPGSIHYRALFMVGIVLFIIALGVNFLAQRIVKRYRISIG
ncbi:MAG: phosphate transporter, inner rane subunit PstC [Chthoniobacteraceae bacterium]|nr:phosphate transporter, inner rane subunit PstC [Chthoniobacteraceae bacterium]